MVVSLYGYRGSHARVQVKTFAEVICTTTKPVEVEQRRNIKQRLTETRNWNRKWREKIKLSRATARQRTAEWRPEENNVFTCSQRQSALNKGNVSVWSLTGGSVDWNGILKIKNLRLSFYRRPLESQLICNHQTLTFKRDNISVSVFVNGLFFKFLFIFGTMLN